LYEIWSVRTCTVWRT